MIEKHWLLMKNWFAIFTKISIFLRLNNAIDFTNKFRFKL